MTDEFDRVEAEGQADRAAVKAERKSPNAVGKRQHGRAQKRRGYMAEKYVEKALAPVGFRRVPLSGALGGALSADVARGRMVDGEWRFTREGRAIERCEVKRRVSGQRLLRRWLAQGGGMDCVVIDTGGTDDQLVVMALPRLVRLLFEAGYAVA